MTLRPFVLALAVSLPLSGLFAQTPQRLQSEKVAYATGGAMKLLRANANGTPSVLVGINDENAELVAPGSRNSEREVSLASRVWMASISESVLGLSGEAELRETSINRTNDLWLSSYELFYDGILVRERIAHLNIGALNGKVIMLRNNLPSLKPVTSVAEIGKDVIMSLAGEIVGSNGTVIEDAHLVYVDNSSRERLDLCYETTIRNAKGDELWRLTFDAATGELLERKDLIVKDCFRYNPLTAIDIGDLSITKTHLQSPQVTAVGNVSGFIHPRTPNDVPVLVGFPIIDMEINGKTFTTDKNGNFSISNVNNPLVISTVSLKNKYITIYRADAASATLLDTFPISPVSIRLTDDIAHNGERDAYYSFEKIRSHIRALDPALTTLDQPMIASVNYPSECNAFYDQSQLGFTFFGASATCNDIASVADVVYHEFGHRVNHARYSQVSGDNNSMIDGSLNEGFADIISAFKLDDPNIGIGFYTISPTKALRNIDTIDRLWPKHINADPHVNGLIIAGAFWDLRKTMGLAQTEKLFHMMCYQRPDGTGEVTAAALEDAFTSTLLATIITDDNDNDLTNGTPNLQKIIEAFEKHNITLSGLIELSPKLVADQTETDEEYAVHVSASYTSSIGVLDTTSIRLHYRHIDSSAYSSITLLRKGTDTYSGAIPKFPAGSIVEYYASAATTLSSTSIKESPLPASPLIFVVGYKRQLLDDCESGDNWLTAENDNATKGIWTHGDPNGTFYSSAANVFVQQDTDHTANGVHCFVTGNQETFSPPLDDVDNGTTSLISPAYDLSNMRDPVIRWWYYFSNNTGGNPGLPKWVVRISSDDGNTYKVVQNTAASTNGWVPYTIRVSELVPLSSAVRLKFIASDNLGSLVEAGVDDIEILDVPTPESVYGGVESDQLFTLYPNPVTGSRVIVKTNGLPVKSLLVLRDVVGKVVHTYMINTGGDETELAIPQSLVNGTYILEYTSDDVVKREKLILAR